MKVADGLVLNNESYILSSAVSATYDSAGNNIASALSGKQNKLTAGEHIAISNDEISVSGIKPVSSNSIVIENSGDTVSIEVNEEWLVDHTVSDSYLTRAKNEGSVTVSSSYALGTSVSAVGTGSVAEGSGTSATGNYSHAEGRITSAAGDYSHAEGQYAYARGFATHTEGFATTARGSYSHAEGYVTSAGGIGSHAEGSGTSAVSNYSHAEGELTIASGVRSHAEGYKTIAGGIASHSEGSGTSALDGYSHAEGQETIASANGSHAEGNKTSAIGYDSHAEGQNTVAYGYGAHAEGITVSAIGNDSHAEGCSTIASGTYAHAEGHDTSAFGGYSHAEGRMTIATSYASHAEGNSTSATQDYTHSEGYVTLAAGEYSHAEGYAASAIGTASHAEGDETIASGNYSHAGGWRTKALQIGSFSHGKATYPSLIQAAGEGAIAMGITDSNGTIAADWLGDHSFGVASDYSTISAYGGGTFARGGAVQQGKIIAVGAGSFAGGYAQTSGTISAYGNGAFAVGASYNNSNEVVLASGNGVIAMGIGASAIAKSYGASVAIGREVIASGECANAQGFMTSALGNYSHAEGLQTSAKGVCSHAEGDGTIAYGETTHAQGRYNTIANSDQAFIIGNGVDGARSDAMIVDWDGNVSAAGYLRADSIATNGGLTAGCVDLRKRGAGSTYMNVYPPTAAGTTNWGSSAFGLYWDPDGKHGLLEKGTPASGWILSADVNSTSYTFNGTATNAIDVMGEHSRSITKEQEDVIWAYELKGTAGMYEVLLDMDIATNAHASLQGKLLINPRVSSACAFDSNFKITSIFPTTPASTQQAWINFVTTSSTSGKYFLMTIKHGNSNTSRTIRWNMRSAKLPTDNFTIVNTGMVSDYGTVVNRFNLSDTTRVKFL